MKKLIATIIGVLFVVGCSNPFKTRTIQQTIQPPQKINRSYDLDLFDSIIVGGDARVKLVKGTCTLEITETQKDDHYDCQKTVKGKTLYINGANNRPSNAIIKVGVYELKNITVTDNSSVSAKNLKTDDLTITATDSGSINLQGKFNIKKINQLGNGIIRIDWIDGNNLHIDAKGDGPIYLAGRINSMLSKLMKKSQLHAQYLRTNKASVFTTDKALAKVLVLDHLNAFAVDESNIYYYKRPKDLTVITRNTANVLHPDWIR